MSSARILMSTHSPAKHECDASQIKPSSFPPLHSDTCRAEAIAHVWRGPDATWTKRRRTDRQSAETAKASGGPSLRTCAVIQHRSTDLFPMQGMCLQMHRQPPGAQLGERLLAADSAREVWAAATPGQIHSNPNTRCRWWSGRSATSSGRTCDKRLR